MGRHACSVRSAEAPDRSEMAPVVGQPGNPSLPYARDVMLQTVVLSDLSAILRFYLHHTSAPAQALENIQTLSRPRQTASIGGGSECTPRHVADWCSMYVIFSKKRTTRQSFKTNDNLALSAIIRVMLNIAISSPSHRPKAAFEHQRDKRSSSGSH